jgi:hypothetical protein
MLLTKRQMCLSLQQIVQDDHSLLNDIIIEYVYKLNDKEFDKLEEYVNSNINEILH